MEPWLYGTDITDAHEAPAGAQSEVVVGTPTALIDESHAYSDVEGCRMRQLASDLSSESPPAYPHRRSELASIKARLNGVYGVCPRIWTVCEHQYPFRFP